MTVDKERIERHSGTPQGGVISPVLANLFMHYAFDKWMERNHPNSPFERYADDAIIHCKTEAEAKHILNSLNVRLTECKLELHPVKTKIVYCKDKDRTLKYENTEFEFLGYCFRRIFIKDRTVRLQFNFLPSVSKIEMISELISPIIRGWMNYFGKFNPSAMNYTMFCINSRLIKWAMRKYKHLRGRQRKATEWMKELAKREPNMFPHWVLGFTP